MVPQKPEDASAFLKKPENRQAVVDAIISLPHLGDLESEEEYRRRIGAEFRECMEIFTRQLGRPPISFCWPWGDYNALAVKEARAAGFKIFFATTRGANLRGHAKVVHRIAVRAISGDELLKTIRFASNAVLESSLGWLSHARARMPRTLGNNRP
jgi:peptidoglycan/xylan/chitin deacetylase (PgdA/CDA1 family)